MPTELLPPRTRLNWWLLLLGWVVVGGITVYRIANAAGSNPLFVDTDDAMRMTVVHDLLNGQNWFDNVQHRLNTPFGAEIHWSRLVDAPIAGLMLLLRPIFGADTDIAVAYVWPMLLLLVLLVLSARVCVTLVGKAGLLPGVVLPALSQPVMTEFVPGRMDHHSVQILLTLAIVWCSLEALLRPRFAIGAGIACATALAIGTEGTPIVFAAVLVFGLMWAATPSRRTTLRHFGISFALAEIVHLAIVAPPTRWFLPACDALSIVFVAGAIGVGVLYFILSLLPLDRFHAAVRLAAGLALGAVLLVVLFGLFPDCRKGPYAAVDPWLVKNWIDIIAEAKPLWLTLPGYPEYTVGASVPPLIAMAFLAWQVVRGRTGDRRQWAILALFFAVSIAIMLLQVRGARVAGILAVPAGAGLIVAARGLYLQHKRNVLLALGLILSWLGFAGVPISMAYGAIIDALPRGNSAAAPASASTALGNGNSTPCLMPAAFADLAALPPERIMTPVDLGSHMLLYTPHSVVGAPYHRAQQGVRDVFRFFAGPISGARAVLKARGIGVVVLCPQIAELRGIGEVAPDSFIRLYNAGKLPGWLHDVTPKGAVLRTYQVLPDDPAEVSRWFARPAPTAWLPPDPALAD